MSAAFKVGDRVSIKNTLNHAYEPIGDGVVTGIDGQGYVLARLDSGEPLCPWPPSFVDLIPPAPAHAIGDLVQPSGAKVEAGPAFQIASSGGAGYYTGLGDYIGVTGTFRAPSAWTSPNLDDLRRDMADLMTARADLLSARDEHLAMRAALDKVRVFFASHRFDSLGVAAGREMREVMAVVLKALDSEKAGK